MYFLFFLVSSLLALDNKDNTINSISINGNEKTKEYIIRREIWHNLNNSKLDSTILQNDLNRLYNLGIFSNVEIFVEDSIYIINVVEAFNVYPIPLIEYNETKNELSYGPAIAHSNFLGKNQKFFLGSFIRGDTGYILGYYNPWIYGNKINLGFLALDLNPQNIFYDYNYNFLLNKLSSGFTLNEIIRYNYEIGYMQIDIPQLSSDHLFFSEINSKELKYDYIYLKLNFQYDERDIYIDPTNGSLIDVSLEHYYDINAINNIWSLSLSYKKFFSIDMYTDPVFSYRFKSITKFPDFDKLPLLSYEYLGGEGNVRGYSSLPDKIPNKINTLIESSNLYVVSLEFQNTLIKRRNFGKIEFGLDALAFFDIGTSSKIFDKIDFQSNIVGYGIGVKFFASSVGPITISIGFNPYGQRFLHLMDSQ